MSDAAPAVLECVGLAKTYGEGPLAVNVLTGADTFWYSGSDKTGAVTSKTCTGWTAASTLFDASYGISSATDEGWIRQSGEATCGLSSYSVLCIGY